MKPLLDFDFGAQVADTISALGYKVTVDPSRIPNGWSWLYDPASLVRGPKYRPDLIVENNGGFVIVELRTGMFLTEPILQARRYADYFGSSVIICVPDDLFAETPASVKEFALEREIRICALSGVGTALKELLSTPLQSITKRNTEISD